MAPRSDATSGTRDVPELELDVRPAPASVRKPEAKPEVETPLELAIDPRALVRERTEGASAAAPATAVTAPPAFGLVRPVLSGPPAMPAPAGGAGLDIASDARLLAEYGDPPRHWVLSPLYAYRVLKRRKELNAALAGRREEAKRTAEEAQNALVAFTERARETAEKTASYASALDDLRRAEELLRSRDRVLANEQDAQKARLVQVDARLSSLEADLASAQREERAVGEELLQAQEALSREEAKLKRAEMELRAAQQRIDGGAGA